MQHKQLTPHCTLFLLVFLYLLTATRDAYSDDNLLAHRLFSEGEYAKAAELFTQPAWKGVAMYRSSQWWRAAEAFARAGDAHSLYNLGNTYIKLGYHALALDAYLQALNLEPSMADARHNADIMRKLLSDESDDKQQGGRQPNENAVDELETEKETSETGSGQGGVEQTDIDKRSGGQSDTPGEQSMDAEADAQPGAGGETDNPNESSQSNETNGIVNGKQSPKEAANQPSGGSENTETANTDTPAAGLRTALETEQATTQWLNQIHHDAARFLERRLTLEHRRRQQAGQAAPEGGSGW